MSIAAWALCGFEFTTSVIPDFVIHIIAALTTIAQNQLEFILGIIFAMYPALMLLTYVLWLIRKTILGLHSICRLFGPMISCLRVMTPRRS